MGASSTKDFAFFHQTGDDFAKPNSPEPPGPQGAVGQAGRFTRRFCEFFGRHFAATSRARQTAKWPASEPEATLARGKSRFLRANFAFKRAPAWGRVCCFHCRYPCEELSPAAVQAGAAAPRCSAALYNTRAFTNSAKLDQAAVDGAGQKVECPLCSSVRQENETRPRFPSISTPPKRVSLPHLFDRNNTHLDAV